MIVYNKSDRNLKELEEKLKSLRDADELTSVEALSRANEIVKIINAIIEVDRENSTELYETAKEAYLIAAEKVPKKESDMVAFPSNYWSLRAKEERLKSRKYSPTRYKTIKTKLYMPKPSPLVFVADVRPTSKIVYVREFDISKLAPKKSIKVDILKSPIAVCDESIRNQSLYEILHQRELDISKLIPKRLQAFLEFKPESILEWELKEPVKVEPFLSRNFLEIKLEKSSYEPIKVEPSESIFVSSVRLPEPKFEKKPYDLFKSELSESAFVQSSDLSNTEIKGEKVIEPEPHITPLFEDAISQYPSSFINESCLEI